MMVMLLLSAVVVAVGSSVVDALVSAVGSVVGLPELPSVVGSVAVTVVSVPVPVVSSPPQAAVMRSSATMQGEVNRVMPRPYVAPPGASPGAWLAAATRRTHSAAPANIVRLASITASMIFV